MNYPIPKLQAVQNNEVDMKCGAQLLGVSYSSLYGRCKDYGGISTQHRKNYNKRLVPLCVAQGISDIYTTDRLGA